MPARLPGRLADYSTSGNRSWLSVAKRCIEAKQVKGDL
jgi:hypothetical protein